MDYTDICKRVTELREHQPENQKDFAVDVLKIKYATYRPYEKGRMMVEMLKFLRNKTGVSYDWRIDGVEQWEKGIRTPWQQGSKRIRTNIERLQAIEETDESTFKTIGQVFDKILDIYTAQLSDPQMRK